MIPPPIALALTFCNLVIVEEGTRKVSLIGNLNKLSADAFPFVAPPFYAFVALTEGLGDATIDLVGISLETLEEIYTQRRQARFSDKLQELHVVFQLDHCVFPAPGSYQFTLFVDQEWVSQRRLRVVTGE